MPADEARRLTPESDLASLFFDHTGYLIHKWTHYLGAYQEEFGRFRKTPVRMLEIGVSRGGSLQLWRKYFGPQASIWGVDIDERCATLQGDFHIRIGSQDDAAFLTGVVKEMGGVDIVLDDGSHVARHQDSSFRTLFPLLSEGGVYAVEDLHTSYWHHCEGGYRRTGTFIETAKALLDDMHAWYHDRGDSQGAMAAHTIPRVTFYDSIVFISKAQRQRPIVTKIGTPTF